MRTILVHVNVELEDTDPRTAEDVAETFEHLVDGVLAQYPTAMVALVEEV